MFAFTLRPRSPSRARPVSGIPSATGTVEAACITRSLAATLMLGLLAGCSGAGKAGPPVSPAVNPPDPVATATPPAAAQVGTPPPVRLDTMVRLVDALAADIVQRLGSDALKGWPVVVRGGAGAGAGPAAGPAHETVAIELLRTRLLELNQAVEVACPVRCVEVTVLQVSLAGVAAPEAGQWQALAGGTFAGATPDAPGSADAGSVAAVVPPRNAASVRPLLLVGIAARDGNRYVSRAQLLGGLAAAP